jgi:hypothetical protein
MADDSYGGAQSLLIGDSAMVALHYSPLALFPRPAAAESDVRELLVDGRRLDHSLCARREPRARLIVHAYDCDHAAGTSDIPLLVGEHMMLRFPARAGRLAWNAFGRVVACEAHADGYRVTIDFDPLPAA